MKITLDWNCIISVENDEVAKDDILVLVEAHRSAKIDVALLATSASENTKSKRFPGNASLFRDRVKKLGFDHLPIVPMPAVSDLSYYDFCYWVEDSDEFNSTFDKIWSVIASRTSRDFESYLTPTQALADGAIQSEECSKWRNSWCDVMSAYSHIHAKRDVFVTQNTKDFQAHSVRLAELGMTSIKSPNETVAYLTLLKMI